MVTKCELRRSAAMLLTAAIVAAADALLVEVDSQWGPNPFKLIHIEEHDGGCPLLSSGSNVGKPSQERQSMHAPPRQPCPIFGQASVLDPEATQGPNEK